MYETLRAGPGIIKGSHYYDPQARLKTGLNYCSTNALVTRKFSKNVAWSLSGQLPAEDQEVCSLERESKLSTTMGNPIQPQLGKVTSQLTEVSFQLFEVL